MLRIRFTLITLTLVIAACAGGTDADGAPDPVTDDGTSGSPTSVATTGSGTAGASTTDATIPGTAAPPDTATPDTGGGVVNEIVRFASGDEFLEASMWPGGPIWIVLGHMRPADRASWADIGNELAGAGYGVLAYDNRGYGGSTGAREPFALLDDARAAIAFARAEGASAVVYGGASMNGATAMIVGATEDVAAVFMLSAVGSFPSVEDAESFLPQITVPIAFFAAYDDGTAADDVLMTFTALAPTAQATYFQVGGHGTDMYPANPGLVLDLLAFLEQSVG